MAVRMAGNKTRDGAAEIRARMRSEFGELPFPLLNIALRELDQIVLDRVAADPGKVAAELAEFDSRPA